jgi:hypothetical protein
MSTTESKSASSCRPFSRIISSFSACALERSKRFWMRWTLSSRLAMTAIQP